MARPSSQAPGRGDESGLLTITVLPGEAGIRLAGDVDMSTHDRLRQALAALPAGGPAVHFYLGDLRFIDVAGARELLSLTQAHPRMRLILHDPPRALRRLIILLWPRADVEIRDSTPQTARGVPGHGDWLAAQHGAGASPESQPGRQGADPRARRP